MTRLSTVPGFKRRYAAFHFDDGRKTVYVDGQTEYRQLEISRSDITVNQFDYTGWRKPSKYNAQVLAAEAGTLSAKFNQPPYKRKFVVEGHFATTAGTLLSITGKELSDLLPKYPSPFVTESVVKAKNKVADRVAQFGESIAEMRSTLKFVTGSAHSLAEFLSWAELRSWDRAARALGLDPKSRKARRATKTLNGLPAARAGEAWVVYNFAIAPIIDDMVALMIAFGIGKDLRVTGKAGVERYREYTSQRNATIGYIGATYQYTETRKTTESVYTRLDYAIKWEEIRQLTSYGLLDAPATLWAVVPYSFLVDFVLPVSEVLRSLTATVGLRFKGGSSTLYSCVEKSVDGFIPPAESNYLKVETFAASCPAVKGKMMDRRVYGNDPVFVDLWIKNPIAPFEVITALSLLALKLGKAFKPPNM